MFLKNQINKREKENPFSSGTLRTGLNGCEQFEFTQKMSLNVA